MQLTDQRLIEAHLQGDPQAFEALVRRYGPALLGYLVRLCGCRDRAEDCFQETFKRVHEKAHTIRGKSFRPWLYRVATNVALDGFRQQRRQPVVLESDVGQVHETGESVLEQASDSTMEPSDELIRAEQTSQVRDAVASLPEKQRATLILVYYQKLSYTQAAESMGCSLGTVKTQMFRALQALVKRLPDPDE